MFACAILISLQPSQAEASALDILRGGSESEGSEQILTVLDILAKESGVTVEATVENPENQEDEVTKRTVAKGESLSKIAKEFKTTWKRIYDKNESIGNPDQLNPGIVLVIPTDDEELEPRALPEPPAKPVVASSSIRRSTAAPVSSVASRPVGSSDGNRYVKGYCTWYVKGRRPDLPNNLGDARTWVSRAAAQGLPTGSAPRVGAVGQRGNHVVYVESVNADGTVTISEMNRRALYDETTRTVPASYFSYVY